MVATPLQSVIFGKIRSGNVEMRSDVEVEKAENSKADITVKDRG